MNELVPVNILLVEDDPGDQKLVKISLKDDRIANDLHIVNNGKEALDYLYNRGDYSNGTPRPDLILLDLNMPEMDGKEFLKQIKSDEDLKAIPVVILTTSSSEKDILEGYNLQASGYVNKPPDLMEFKQVIKNIKEYWFVICKRPLKEM